MKLKLMSFGSNSQMDRLMSADSDLLKSRDASYKSCNLVSTLKTVSKVTESDFYSDDSMEPGLDQAQTIMT